MKLIKFLEIVNLLGGAFITLNDTLAEGELKKLRKAAKEYSDKNNKKLSEMNEKTCIL